MTMLRLSGIISGISGENNVHAYVLAFMRGPLWEQILEGVHVEPNNEQIKDHVTQGKTHTSLLLHLPLFAPEFER